MGEGGVSPDYFLHKMQWWEVNRYLTGLHRRYRSSYESARLLQWTLACMFHDKKNGAPPSSPQDFYKFSWEEDSQQQSSSEITEQEAADLRQMMADYKW